jgi:hypothetical protein
VGKVGKRVGNDFVLVFQLKIILIPTFPTFPLTPIYFQAATQHEAESVWGVGV